MAVDTDTKIGKFLEGYVNLFSNRWNSDCDICWFLFGCCVHGILGCGLGLVFASMWIN